MALPFAKIEDFVSGRVAGGSVRGLAGSATVVIDSRKVTKGALFVALKGEHHDAHSFITPALARTAAACVVNQSWYAVKKPRYGRFILVEDTGDTLMRMASAYLQYLGTRVVAVTGSNGKTTTRAMIARVLAAKYRVHATRGNFNNRIGLPLSVFEISPRDDITVLELGANHFGEISELSWIVKPDIAVITNIGHSHLEFFKDRKGVLKAKTEIVHGMRSGGVLVVNGDDDLLNKYEPPRRITKRDYGFAGERGYRGSGLTTGFLRGGTFTFNGVAMVTPLPGNGAAANALCAAAVVDLLGVTARETQKALARIEAPENRMDMRIVGGARIIADCYNANPDSMANAFGLLKAEKIAGRKIAVLGDMRELGAQAALYHRQTGALAAKSGVKLLFTLGELGRKIAQGAIAAGLHNVYSFAEKEKDALADVLRSSLKKGDLVLIKGSHSMGMEEIVERLE